MVRSTPPSRAERLVRALLLLATSIIFTLLAWLLGAYQLQNSTLTYICIAAIVIAAVLVSRFGTKLVMQRLRLGGNP